MNKKTAIVLAISAAKALAADNAFTMDTLSVTALREEESVKAQPLSIATKQANEIELDHVIFQKDLLNSLAGVRIEQTGSIIGHKTSIRMPMTTDPYYLFLQDGIPVQSSGFFNHNGLAYTTFGSASSVEVLKGTATALYGSDAMAGTINVIGAAEPSKKLEQSVAVSGGSDGFGSLRTDVSNTPNNKSSYRFGVRYDHSDGWREHTAFERFEANGRYDYLINNDNSVKVMVSTTKSDAEQADDFQNYSNIENGSTLASDRTSYYTALSKTDVRRKFEYARIAAEFTNFGFDDAELTFTPYIRYNRNRYATTWENNVPSNDSIQKSIGLMQKTKFTPSWGRLIVGFDTEYTQADQKTNQEFDYNATIVTGAIYDYTVGYFAIAPYMHADYKITDTVMANIGLRYDFNRYDYKNNLVDGNVYNVYYRTANRTDSYSHLSPKFSLSYRPAGDVDLYARYANGFRIPQSTMLYSLIKGYETFGLDPETSDTYEVGAKYGNTNHYIELSGYYMTIDNTFTQYDNGTVKYYGNGGEGIHKGIEVGASTKLNNEVELKGAYSYSRHNYNNNNPTFKDKEMANAPKNTANGRVFYSPEGLKGLVIMGEVQYVGSYWMDNANTRRYGGYCIENLKADYKLQSGLSMFAKVTNITDERYAVSATYAFRNSYTPGDPRQFFAGLEYTW